MTNTVILLPTYNERDNILCIVPEIFATRPDVRILVIDDNSPDGTGDVVRTLMRSFANLDILSRPKKQGLGEAYKAGMTHVLSDDTVERVITMDADGSHAVEYLPGILEVSDTHDLVIGSRYVPGGGIENWEKWRYALSKWGNFYARTITGLPVRDLTAGFMCFHADVLRNIDFSDIQASGYAFLMGLKFSAIHIGKCSFKEVPIVFRVRREGESKISHHIIHEGLKTPWGLAYRKWFL
jgi:dolichol-phosphate mannosyltransferase